MTTFLTEALMALSFASVFALAALGLHYTFGQLGIFNVAHGEFILVGAYTVYFGQSVLGSVWLGIALAPFTTAFLGFVVERGLIRWFYSKPVDSIIATFGLALIIQQGVQLIYSPVPRTVDDPVGGGSLDILGAQFPKWRAVVLGFACLSFLILFLVWNRTSIGLKAKAAVTNPGLAESLTVNVPRMRILLFVLGSALAGFASALIAPLGTLTPQFGVYFLVNSFLVIIIGGVGSLAGVAIGGAFLGIVQQLLETQMSTIYAQIAVLIVAIAVIRLRGTGLGPWLRKTWTTKASPLLRFPRTPRADGGAGSPPGNE